MRRSRCSMLLRCVRMWPPPNSVIATRPRLIIVAWGCYGLITNRRGAGYWLRQDSRRSWVINGSLVWPNGRVRINNVVIGKSAPLYVKQTGNRSRLGGKVFGSDECIRPDLQIVVEAPQATRCLPLNNRQQAQLCGAQSIWQGGRSATTLL